MNSHQKRLLTAAVLVPILIYFIFWATPGIFGLGVFVFSTLGLWEFYSLFWIKEKILYKIWGILLSGPIVFNFLWSWEVSFFVLLSFWAMNIIFLFNYSLSEKISWKDLQLVTCGLIYIPLVLQFLNYLSSAELVLVLLASFISDTAAFYVGSLFGKKKLWPRISPKKSWEGAMGGLFFCILTCLIVGVIAFQIDWYHWLWIGLLLNLGAQFGDLFESALKRKLKIKDSSHILPGHGGFLDRFDSVLLVVPIYMVIKQFFPLFLI